MRFSERHNEFYAKRIKIKCHTPGCASAASHLLHRGYDVFKVCSSCWELYRRNVYLFGKDTQKSFLEIE